MTAYPLRYESGVVYPNMWKDYPGGLWGYLGDLTERMPNQLIIMASGKGLAPVRNFQVEISRKQRVEQPDSSGEKFLVYKIFASGYFSPTRCIPEYQHHQRPHSEECSMKRHG